MLGTYFGLGLISVAVLVVFGGYVFAVTNMTSRANKPMNQSNHGRAMIVIAAGGVIGFFGVLSIILDVLFMLEV